MALAGSPWQRGFTSAPVMASCCSVSGSPGACNRASSAAAWRAALGVPVAGTVLGATITEAAFDMAVAGVVFGAAMAAGVAYDATLARSALGVALAAEVALGVTMAEVVFCVAESAFGAATR